MKDEEPVFAGKKRIRLGVWGLGRGLHIVSVAKALNIDVVAGCDFNPHFVKLFQEQIPEGRFTDDAETFLSWDFDAVLLATYCPAHADHAIACLRAGKHVLSEVTAFHTLAEGARLVDAVEESGLVYQLAENYPYTPANRYLARKWKEGLFGDLQYAEYGYVHDCLNYLYMYIDGTPLEPGNTAHAWRSWLPWHYYCTHSLGPVLAITGRRPKKVVTLPSGQRLAGQLRGLDGGLSGMAPSLIELDNGGLVRNLMGNTTNDRCFDTLYGTKGASMIMDSKLSLQLGGRGHSPCYPINLPMDRLDRMAKDSGHGGGDFWILYHFANELLNGIKGPFDIYGAADVTLPGILAYRSANQGGVAMEVPDFRVKSERDDVRGDDTRIEAYDTKKGVFPVDADFSITKQFSHVMTETLYEGDRWQAVEDWSKVFDECGEQGKVIKRAEEFAERLPGALKHIEAAKQMIEMYPKSDGATVLAEALTRFDLEFLSRPDALSRYRERIEELKRRKARNDERALRFLLPQLCMKRVGFDELPELQLPEGYSIRTHEEGDWKHWCRIIGEAFDEDLGEEHFNARMLGRSDGRADRIYFIVDSQGTPCATASAYGNDLSGYVHYVGVVGGHLGKRLGYWVSLATLHDFKKRGCQSCTLQTDDFRVPALKTYRRLGFKPLLVDGGQVERWKQIANRLDAQDLLDSAYLD